MSRWNEGRGEERSVVSHDGRKVEKKERGVVMISIPLL